jgi:benzoyl-CoA reductase/2-hydroxyglutaryl-CoA dehydratase subunit BcrC/BadD/HgdB
MNILQYNKDDRRLQYKNLLKALGENNNPDTLEPDKLAPDALESSKKRSVMNAYRLSSAYKPESKVVYVGEQFPNEILYALNLISWNVESMGILCSQFSNADDFLRLTEEENIARDICSNVRAPLGFTFANCYPTPDIILVNDHPCDALAKLAHLMSVIYRRPFFSLSTPNKVNKESVAYLLKQLKDMIAVIESTLNLKFNKTQFRRVIQYSNEAREYYFKTIQLFKKARLPGVARELLEIFGMNHWGLKETVNICKTLYEEAVEKSRKPENRKKVKRLLWAGQAPGNSHEIVRYIEREYEIIFWPTLWESNFIILDNHNPLKSIAERSIRYLWNAERYGANTSDICDQFDIEGIIILNIWGCRNMMGMNHMLRELIKKKNLKSLTLNADYIDRNNYSFPHVKNRIDAFLEILNNNH